MATGMLIHGDEPSGIGVIVSGAKMIQAGCRIEALARVAVSGAAGRVRVPLVAKRIKVQRFNGLARCIGHQSGAALDIGVEVLLLPVLRLADLQAHAIGSVQVQGLLPRAAVGAGAL